MKAKAPVSIITDQDAAMRSAIAKTFPNTNHQNCRWHIMDKFSGTIGPVLAANAELEDDFKECLNHTVNPAELEAKWAAMINKYVLHDDVHFQHLYTIRSSFCASVLYALFLPFLAVHSKERGVQFSPKKVCQPEHVCSAFC